MSSSNEFWKDLEGFVSIRSIHDFQVLIDFEEKLNIIFVFEVSFTELHGHSVLFHRLIYYLKRFAFGNASYQTE